MYKWRPGRLFWKLLLALWVCMILSIAGVATYFQLTGRGPPPSVDGIARIGVLPVAPLVSAGVAILVTGLALAWYLSRPLQHLRWALRRIAEGHLDTRVQPLMGRRSDEIADLAHDFDRMAVRLQQLTESRKVLLHDISHELRSPLTRIQAAIGLLRQDPAQSEAMIGRIGREGERLDALIEELLTLHRMEAGVAARERVDVIELLYAIAEDADFEARASSRSLVIEAPGQFVADVNGDLIYRAFENVIRNAVKFSPEGAVVEVRSRIVGDGRVLETVVSDRGPGVPEHMLESIFQPFTRVEGQEPVHGAGLGLAISRRAMEMHGGQVVAARRAGGGLEVVLTLPLRDA
ncbi:MULTISPECIES: ATP-binding protein [unclassified Lysobacter]|uniref:HAMP domain-containing sensor histidine kinase n=1 Tax=unclassified Lysobacter TaxID=2635362 RepID=UPI0006FC6604|nr:MULTISPECIES: ATP-binding protein [unclassified Lysobacter]KQZ68003.1 histidine kinase [Lysobacter sp. Root559]KRC38329.1 histidine kinase [Lysobacter sp. Root76]KRD69653.1 histidine kinase [Lysobacter sp. Root96]